MTITLRYTLLAMPDAPADPIAIPVPADALAAVCRRWHVARLELFGSVLRPADFRPDSDVDVMVTFDPGTGPTLLAMTAIQDELERLFARPVDLLTRRSIERGANRFRRQTILDSVRVAYAGGADAH